MVVSFYFNVVDMFWLYIGIFDMSKGGKQFLRTGVIMGIISHHKKGGI